MELGSWDFAAGVLVAPTAVDDVRRLMTAEIRIDGESQGPVAEALVRVNQCHDTTVSG